MLALSGGDTPETLAPALATAHAHDGLSLVHVPVYGGDDPVGGLGVYGRGTSATGSTTSKTRYLRTTI